MTKIDLDRIALLLSVVDCSVNVELPLLAVSLRTFSHEGKDSA
jgi:hypothetical protein